MRNLVFDIYLKRPATNSALVYRVEINGQWKQVMYTMDSTFMFNNTFEDLSVQFEEDWVEIDSVITL